MPTALIGCDATLRACLILRLRNRTFKSKRAFGQKLIFKLLPKVFFLTIFMFFEPLKAFLIFLPNDYFFSSNELFEC